MPNNFMQRITMAIASALEGSIFLAMVLADDSVGSSGDAMSDPDAMKAVGGVGMFLVVFYVLLYLLVSGHSPGGFRLFPKFGREWSGYVGRTLVLGALAALALSPGSDFTFSALPPLILFVLGMARLLRTIWRKPSRLRIRKVPTI